MPLVKHNLIARGTARVPGPSPARVAFLVSALAASRSLGAVLLVFTLLAGCGRLNKQEVVREGYSVPAFLSAPLPVSPVAIGSHDVVAAPPPGAVPGTLLMTILSEPGAHIYYSLQSFAADSDETKLTLYQTPLLLLPPVTVWAQADVGGARGPVKAFAYDFSSSILPPLVPDMRQRLTALSPEPLATGLALSVFPPGGGAARLTAGLSMDGLAQHLPPDFVSPGASSAADGLGDVPPGMESIDIAWATAGETDDSLYAVTFLKAPPENSDAVTYGFDIGPSNVSFQTFGPGANYSYRVAATHGALSVTRKSDNQKLPLSAASRVALGDIVEFQLAKADLPDLAGTSELAVRMFTEAQGLGTGGTAVIDRMEPFFLRSAFQLSRGTVHAKAPAGAASKDPRLWQIDFRTDPVFANTGLAQSYIDLSAAAIPELEQMNALRFYTSGTLPLFFVDKDENGYAGLNTSDRGVLTTIGQNTSILARAQLLAHELAHYQNARNSQLKPRWLQEGMSEWSAERFLYRHFPRRAVHKYLRALRFDRFFDTLNGGLDSFPLAQWGTEPAVLGYEKSLMFIDLLELEVGQPALLAAFQQAVNEPMDTDGFKAFLEKTTGKDLTALFRYWAYPGTPDPAYDPYTLFKPAAGDDLLGIDKLVLGLDPTRLDSDGDGFPDGEEYFRGLDPKVSNLTPAQEAALGDGTVSLLVNADDPDGSALMRLGGTPGAVHKYSLNPFAAQPSIPAGLPVLLRPPYTLAVQTESSGQTGSVQVLRRELFVGGVRQQVTLATSNILPKAPLTTLTLRSDVTVAPGAGRGGSDLVLSDTPGDLPAYLAAYDLTSTRVDVADATYNVTLGTLASPSQFGDYGDYLVSFNNIAWSNAGPTVNHRYTVSMSAGAPYLGVVSGTGETTGPMTQGISWSMATNLTLNVAATEIPAWQADVTEKLVCAYTQITLEGGTSFKDHAGCVTTDAPGFVRLAASLPDYFGLTPQTLEVFVATDGSTGGNTLAGTRAQELTSLGTAALGAFEQVTGRPLWERSYWPAHVFYLASGAATSGSAQVDAGAYLSIDAGLTGPSLDYLFVEQLARLAAADLLEKNAGATPFWLQEIYIQWLASSALYKFYPSRDVHGFHRSRIDEYLHYINGDSGYQHAYTHDVALPDWNLGSLASTGSVKSLLFILELDATVGADVMAEIFATYPNSLPDAATFKALCLGYGPTKTAEVEALWAKFIDGNDVTGIKNTLIPMNSGLYLFEAQKLQAAGGNLGSYLN